MKLSEMRAEFDRLGETQPLGAFDELPNKPSTRRDLCGFLKLEQLLPNSGRSDMISCAEHDQIWLDIDIEELANVATLDDIAYLSACGVFLDGDVDSLSMFV